MPNDQSTSLSPMKRVGLIAMFAVLVLLMGAKFTGFIAADASGGGGYGYGYGYGSTQTILSAPTGLQSNSYPGGATFTWVAPSGFNSSESTNYFTVTAVSSTNTITASTDPANPSDSLNLTGLFSGITYSVSVTATDNEGTSPNSTSINVTIPSSVSTTTCTNGSNSRISAHTVSSVAVIHAREFVKPLGTTLSTVLVKMPAAPKGDYYLVTLFNSRGTAMSMNTKILPGVTTRVKIFLLGNPYKIIYETVNSRGRLIIRHTSLWSTFLKSHPTTTTTQPVSTTTTQPEPTTTTQPVSTTTTTTQPIYHPPTTTTTPLPVLPLVVLSSNSFHPGATINLQSTGFKPNSVVTIQIHSACPITLSTVTADSSGNISTPLQVPSGISSGSHQFVLQGLNPSSASMTVSAPVSVLVSTSGLTVPFTGRVTTQSGVGVPELFINVQRVDGTASASGRTDSNGNFNIDIPTGLDKFQIFWVSWTGSVTYSTQLSIPDSWYYTVNSFDVTNALNWNLQLPATTSLTVTVPNNELSGSVQLSPDGFCGGDCPAAQTTSLAIAPGVVGQLENGGLGSKIVSVSHPANFFVFPENSLYVWDSTNQYSGNGFGLTTGVSNVSANSPTTVNIPDNLVPLTLNIQTTNGTSSNAGPITITALDSTFQSNGHAPNGTYLVPANVPFTFKLYGAHSRTGGSVGVSNGPMPPNWSLTSGAISISSATTISMTLPPTIDINVDFSTSPAFGTGRITVSDDAKNAISVSYTGGTATLTNGITEGEQTGGDFYLFDNGSNLTTSTVTCQGQIGNTYSSVSQVLNLQSVAASSAQTIRCDLTPSGSLTGTVQNAVGGVGIVRTLAENTTNNSITWGDSNSSGNISISAPGNTNKVVITGDTNILSSAGVPPQWWLVVTPTSSNIGTFTLPSVENLSLQVVDNFGLPIQNAQLAEVQPSSGGGYITLTSSNGTVGRLYNGFCNMALGCVLPPGSLPYSFTSWATTDANGVATIIRFATSQLGGLSLTLPGYGSNQPQTNILVSGSKVVGGQLSINNDS